MLIYNTLIYIFICLFFFILYTQSCVDKIICKKENLTWLRGHFKGSPFTNIVPFLFFVITVFEGVTAFLFLINILVVLSDYLNILESAILIIDNVGHMGAFFMSMLTLVSLFFGQRLAKDYEGAKTIAVYFMLNIIAIIFVVEYCSL